MLWGSAAETTRVHLNGKAQKVEAQISTLACLCLSIWFRLTQLTNVGHVLIVRPCCGQMSAGPRTRPILGSGAETPSEQSEHLTALAQFQGPIAQQAARRCDRGSCVKVVLPTFQGLWQTDAANNCSRETDAPLSQNTG